MCAHYGQGANISTIGADMNTTLDEEACTAGVAGGRLGPISNSRRRRDKNRRAALVSWMASEGLVALNTMNEAWHGKQDNNWTWKRCRGFRRKSVEKDARPNEGSRAQVDFILNTSGSKERGGQGEWLAGVC